MSDSESINSEEIKSASSSDNESEGNKTKEKPLDKVKKSLNLPTNEKQKSKVYYLQNQNSIEEKPENVATTKSQKIGFNDVLKIFQKNITNETSRTNLAKGIKTFGLEKEENDNKNDNKNNNKNVYTKSDLHKVEIDYKKDKEEKLLEKQLNYNSLNKEISKYKDKVKNLREADVVDFTHDDRKLTRHIGDKTLKEIISVDKNKLNSNNINNNNIDLTSQINQMLIKNNYISDEKILEKENKELLHIDPEELKRRYNELKSIRSRLLQKEIENKRKGKIKSKLYHKIAKKKRIKEENDLLEQLGTVDPEAVKNYLEKKKIDRVQERMLLKHSQNSKFQKVIKRYHFDKDLQVKEAIKENFQLRDKLMQKIKGEDDDNLPEEEEENEEDGDEGEEVEEDNNNNSEKSVTDGIVEQEDGQKKFIINFDNNKKDKNDYNIEESNKNESMATGVFNMPFMKKAEKDRELQEKLQKLKEKIDEEEDSDEEDVNKSSDEDKEAQSDKNNNKINKNKNKNLTLTEDNINKIAKDSKKYLNNNKDNDTDIKLNEKNIEDMIKEEEINDDIEQFNAFLIENDENKKEFIENENEELMSKIKKDNPDFLPGWDSWTGNDKEIKAKEFLKKKRYERKVNMLKEQAMEADKNKFVKINKGFDKNFSNYLVKDLPLNIKNREQYEKLNKNLIGRDANSLLMYKKMIQPSIIKKIGKIIDPMTMNDSTKGMQIQEIIEKATRKKVRTKAKL